MPIQKYIIVKTAMYLGVVAAKTYKLLWGQKGLTRCEQFDDFITNVQHLHELHYSAEFPDRKWVIVPTISKSVTVMCSPNELTRLNTLLLRGRINIETANFLFLMKIEVLILIGAIIACCPNIGLAQNPNDTSLQKNALLGDVVITGQYSPNNPEKAVQKIKIIDRSRMDAMNAQNLKDVLTNELNVRLSQDNILGSSMSLQGISGQNIKILIDGVPVIGRQDGNIDLSQINLNNIERIEIVEGPMSVTYGTNALAGTINLITKKPKRNRIEGNLSTYYESIGSYNSALRLGGGIKRHAIAISGGRNFFDGWKAGEIVSLDFSPHLADSTRYTQWKPREQYMAGAQYEYRAKKTTYTYKLDYFNEKITNRGMPMQPYREFAFDDYYRTYRTDNAFFLKHELREQKYVTFQVAYNMFRRIKNTYYNDLTTLNRSLTTNDGDQDTSKFNNLSSRATFSTSKNGKLNYEAGYDINVEDATGIRIKKSTRQIGDYAAFASAEYKPIEQLTIRPGLRYSYNTAFAAPLIPSLNVRYKAGHFTVRGAYAKGFRSPSLKELYFYFVDINHNIKGNENLKPEYSDNYSVSTIYSGGKNVSYKIEMTAFYNNIHNLITLALVTGSEYSYTNVGKYKTRGVQVNGDISYRQLKLSLGVACSGRYNMLSETYNIASFNYSPEIRGNVIYQIKWQHITVAAFYKFTGEMQGFSLDANNNVQQTFINAYHTADASLSKKFFKKQLDIAVGCKNILDVRFIGAYAAGGAHTSSGTEIPVSCGRLYFIKVLLNDTSKNEKAR